MTTRTSDPGLPADYDPSQFPAFAVTVDVVILTMSEGTLHVLLVRRGEAPFGGMWAIPGGFKRPTETLDEAARRELAEETGVDVPSLLTQFGAYGDPERDPRMNVVTIGYLAVLRDVGAVVAGTDAADAALVPASDVLNERINLAFDHLRIVRDAVERVRVELEVSGIATAFVGTTFTMAELRAVYEAIWGVQLDAANFRRSVVAEDGWGHPDRAPGSARRSRRQACGVVPRWTDVEARRTDSVPATGREAKGNEMRAVVYDRYGPPEVLRIEEVERPVPRDDEVLVRIHATTVTRTDCGMRGPEPFFARIFTGLLRPKRRILGMELAGEVEAVGAAVSEFEVGDEVFGVKGFGAHAEYVCIRETAALAHKPLGMSFDEAAAVSDGPSIALACLKKADLREGRSILIYGASGSIGTAAVQCYVSSAPTSPRCATRRPLPARSLGADEVVDYTQEDFTKNGETYDVIFDAVGKHSFRRCRHSLKPGGIYIETDLGFMWHVPPLALAHAMVRRQEGDAPDTRVDEGGRPPRARSSSRRGSTAQSSTERIRSRTSSRRRATSRRDRRPATSS